MPKHTTSISIPQPCHENWDAMTPSQQGRHCAVCQKVVIDFTLMTDGQILDVFDSAKNNLPCGHFLDSQLSRPLIDNRYKPSFAAKVVKRVAAMVLILQTITLASNAQQKRNSKIYSQHAKGRTAGSKALIIKGKIIDNETRRPVKGVRIYIDGHPLDSLTDDNGVFALRINELPKDSIWINAQIINDNNSLIENEKVSTEDIKNGKEIVMYRYVAEQLKAVEIKQYLAPVSYGGYPSVHTVIAEEIKPQMPKPHLLAAYYQTI